MEFKLGVTPTSCMLVMGNSILTRGTSKEENFISGSHLNFRFVVLFAVVVVVVVVVLGGWFAVVVFLTVAYLLQFSILTCLLYLIQLK